MGRGVVMKPFNLEEYLNNPSSRTLVTRDGCPARIICTDALNIDQHPIIAQVLGEDGYEETVYYNRQGTVFNDKPTENDLFFVSEEHQSMAYDVPKKEKFDPNTLQPFDKVLVRDLICDCWNAVIFSHINFKRQAICCGISWEQCVPYNEETKYLVNTNEDCPEYYKWWKI